MSGSTIKNLSALLKYTLKISKYIFGDISKYLADILIAFTLLIPKLCLLSTEATNNTFLYSLSGSPIDPKYFSI